MVCVVFVALSISRLVKPYSLDSLVAATREREGRVALNALAQSVPI